MNQNTSLEIRDCTALGSEICRELCDGLMQYQASMAKEESHRKILGSMCYDNRLKPSFESTQEKLLLVAFDGERPVGYMYAAASLVTQEDKNWRPSWGKDIPGEVQGFYPDWLPTPVKIGSLNNLFVLPQYRGQKIGLELAQRGMDWLRQLPEVSYLFVDVSEGNNAAQFYSRFGFQHSHSVLGGLIEAYYIKL